MTLRISGWLDAHTVASVWEQVRRVILRQKPRQIVVDAAQIQYCDGAGIAMFVDLQRQRGGAAAQVEIRDLPAAYQPLLELFDSTEFKEFKHARPEPAHLPQQVGEAAAELWRDMVAQVRFVGELAAALGTAARRAPLAGWVGTR